MFVQTINILIVHQSVLDICASFLTLVNAVVKVDGTRMSSDNNYDQFVYRVWLTRALLWASLLMSTYGILTTAVERYIAVIYPIWYNVRMNNHLLKLMQTLSGKSLSHNLCLCITYSKTKKCKFDPFS